MIKRQLDRHNLFCCATHEGIDTLKGDAAPLIDRLQTLECDFTALGAPPVEYRNSVEGLNELIRISGDEIICLLPNCNESEAELVGRKIIEARQQYNKNAPIRMPVFFSIGIKTIDLSAYAGRDLHAEEKEEALGIFYQSIQDADMLMQENKRLARAEHYGLVQAYIEKSLNHPISLSDNRLF